MGLSIALALVLAKADPSPLLVCDGTELKVWCCRYDATHNPPWIWQSRTLCVTSQAWNQHQLLSLCMSQACGTGLHKWYLIGVTCGDCGTGHAWIGPHQGTCNLPDGCAGNDDSCMTWTCDDIECHDSETEPWRHTPTTTDLSCPV